MLKGDFHPGRECGYIHVVLPLARKTEPGDAGNSAGLGSALRLRIARVGSTKIRIRG
jgi:hypothetical protein